MKRSILSTAVLGIAASMGAHLGSLGMVRNGIQRVASGSKRARQMINIKTPRARSKYAPHIGAKEQERAKRCYMVNGVLHQMSKREYAARLEAERNARAA